MSPPLSALTSKENTVLRRPLWILATLPLWIAACGNEQTPASSTSSGVAEEEKVLNIYNWPDYIPEGMLAAFEKETGIKVNYDTFETNEALNAKLVAGKTGYDIVVPGAVFAKGQIEAGLLRPLNKQAIPNLKNLDPAIMATLTKTDPDNRHLVPWAWGFTTVGINETKVKAALGSTPIPDNTWELVFNPTYTSKLKACGIAYLDSPTEIMPVALHHMGKDAYSSNPSDYAAAADMLAKVRGDIRLFSSTMIDDIASGKACVAIGWSGDINIAAARAEENGSKDVIRATLPSAGALIFFDNIAITQDAKHPQNAHRFIDFYLRAENAAAMANEMSYPTGNTAAMGSIDASIANNDTIFVKPDYMAKMIRPSSFSNEARQALANAYNRFKSGS
jgi:putrescine transport system substrate-binding protein